MSNNQKTLQDVFIALLQTKGKKTDLQSRTKYLKRADYGECSISIFPEFFASIDKTFILRGSLSARL